MDMEHASALYRLLGDTARLRLLRVLARDRFNVTELTGILAIAQSGVSRHLGLLKEAGLIEEARDGTFTYYGVSARFRQERPALWATLDAQFEEAAATAEVRADETRLQEVLRVRRENFDRRADADARDHRQLVPGRSWKAWARALGMLLPPLDVADIGCGEGYLAMEAAQWARKVVAIDRSPDVLARGRAASARRGLRNITWKRGELERIPLEDQSMDVVMLSQALHHAPDPSVALTEAVRVLTDGGRLLVLDLRAHDEPWVRQRLGDVWLGFTDERLGELLTAAGLSQVSVRVGARTAGDPFVVLLATGTLTRRRKARHP